MKWFSLLCVADLPWEAVYVANVKAVENLR